MGKIDMGIFYGKLYNSRNGTISLKNRENFIEGRGLELGVDKLHFSLVKVMFWNSISAFLSIFFPGKLHF